MLESEAELLEFVADEKIPSRKSLINLSNNLRRAYYTQSQVKRLLDALNINLSLIEYAILQELYILPEETNKISSSQVMAAYYIKDVSMTRAVNALVKQGYIRKTRSGKDKRIKYLKLTPKGEFIMTKIENSVLEIL